MCTRFLKSRGAHKPSFMQRKGTLASTLIEHLSFFKAISQISMVQKWFLTIFAATYSTKASYFGDSYSEKVLFKLALYIFVEWK